MYVFGLVVTLLLVSSVTASRAFAMTCQKGYHGYAEQEGKGEWCVGSEKPYSTYTAEQNETLKHAYEGVVVDGGASGNTATGFVPGYTEADEEVAKKVIEAAREKPLTGDAADGWAGAMADAGTGLTAAEVAGAISTVGLAALTTYFAIEYGGQVIDMLAWGGTQQEMPNCECTAQLDRVTSNQIEVYSEGPVYITRPADMPLIYTHSTYREAGLTIYGWLNNVTWTTKVAEEMPSCNLKLGRWDPPNGAYVVADSVTLEEYECWYGGTHYGNMTIAPVIAGIKDVWGVSGLKGYGFPGNKLTPPGETVGKAVVAPPGKLTVPPPIPTFAPGSAPYKETEKQAAETMREVIEHAPGVSPAPSSTKEAELVEIPAPGKTETGLQYQKRLEELGFTKISRQTLSETQASGYPDAGPEGVVYTTPAAGSRVEVGTAVIIVQDPATATVPPEESEGIKVPEVAKVELPKLESPCNVFPFGVACWSVERAEEFVTNVRAPVWTLHLGGHPMRIEFAAAEAELEIVRGVELVLGTIGVVLLFGKFASSSSGGGAGSDD